MKKLIVELTVALILVMVVFAVQAQVEKENPTVVTYENEKGNVTFDHSQHINTFDCIECHHEQNRDVCKSCHGMRDQLIDAKSAFHITCKNCHKENSAPTKCSGCHIK